MGQSNNNNSKKEWDKATSHVPETLHRGGQNTKDIESIKGYFTK